MPTERHRYAANRNAKPRRRRCGAAGRRPHQPHPPRTLPEFASQNGEEKPIPPLEAGNIRIVPLGGVEEIGRNMTAIEMGDDIIVVDCGLQFREEDTPGIDYILPNTKYLEDRREKIRGIFVTHGHLDHIGGIPYIIDRLGYPPIYTRQLTAVMIKKRQEEFPHLKPLDIHEVEKEKSIRAGKTKVRFFSVTHTIPDSMGIIVETPYGLIVHTGDLRLEHENGIPSEKEKGEFAIFKKESVLLLMADSTNCEKPGFSIPERVVQKNLDEIITEAKGRLIIGTFSSQLERIMRMLEAAENCGKKVLVEGRSMKVNVEIVKRLGMLKVREKTFIGPEELAGLPDNKVAILATGAQGDEDSQIRADKKGRHHSAFLIHSAGQRACRAKAKGQPLAAGCQDNPSRHHGRSRLRPRQPRRNVLDTSEDKSALLHPHARIPLYASRSRRHSKGVRTRRGGSGRARQWRGNRN